MAKPFVSVLVDTYNHERFIEQAVVSVLEQDFSKSDREIIVVDDGSTDGTPEILRKFEPHIRIIRKSNGGQASAFNAGIPQCRGEIVAFLDGDDWWTVNKLAAVAAALTREKDVGLVGHGITEVHLDGHQQTELLLGAPRLRIKSQESARLFRLRKSFLGTSRMTCRSSVLARIGAVPEGLKVEADEYIFTLAAVFSEVLILREPLTFYRLHELNFFQVSDGNKDALRRKRKVLGLLAESLNERLQEEGLCAEAIGTVVEAIETEAAVVRLATDGGLPWETVITEVRSYRIAYSDATQLQRIFKAVALLPACVLPPRLYYRVRRRLADTEIYRAARRKWLPFVQPNHVERYRN